ncbi:MAG: hypothetical protein JXA33_27040 [Anaerolineae bacterium]|nr:hypothetical protein [Anaerolineae bacterium]
MITTEQLETLTVCINRVYTCQIQRYPRQHDLWRGIRDERIRLLHSVYKPSARRYATEVVATVARLVLEYDVLPLLDFLPKSPPPIAPVQYSILLQPDPEFTPQVIALTQELRQAQEALLTERANATELTATIQDLQAQLAELQTQGQRPQAHTLVVPAQTIEIHSPLKMEALRIIGSTGLARQWRIIEQLMLTNPGSNTNSVRNALRDLRNKHRLLTYYTEREQPVYWAYKASGGSPLILLNDLGETFYRQAFGTEPLKSEILVMTPKHSSATHAVGILEARDELCAAGYEVNDAPKPILADAQSRWGERAEPDLTVVLSDGDWPVEVQREVSERLLDKWVKTLELKKRLVLILFNEEKRQHQESLLRSEIRLRRLPTATIKLTSLEAMIEGDWDWRTLHTARQ